MAAEKPEQDGFLAVIDRKIAALKALADSYRTALSLGALGDVDANAIGASTGGGTRSEARMDLPKGALLGKSLPAAVKLWLQSIRGKQTVREIANALKDGGVESTSPNFENVVTGALHRLKATGEVLRFKDGWAAAELYPAALRANLGKDAKVTKGTKKGATTAPKASKAALPKGKITIKVAKATAKPQATGATGFIEKLIAGDPEHGYTRREVLEAADESGFSTTQQFVRVALRRLEARGKIQRRDGKYYGPLAANTAA